MALPFGTLCDMRHSFVRWRVGVRFWLPGGGSIPYLLACFCDRLVFFDMTLCLRVITLRLQGLAKIKKKIKGKKKKAGAEAPTLFQHLAEPPRFFDGATVTDFSVLVTAPSGGLEELKKPFTVSAARRKALGIMFRSASFSSR